MKHLLRLLALAAVVAVVTMQWRDHTRRERLRALQDSLTAARATALECRQELAIAESEFHERSARVDSLRALVDTLEALDPRGVPAPRYEEYLALVERYNAEVARWGADADALEGNGDSCRAAVERHNRLADSLGGAGR